MKTPITLSSSSSSKIRGLLPWTEISFLQSKNKLVNVRFSCLVSVRLQCKGFHPIRASSSLSSESQADLENAETRIKGTYQSNTVHVKFQLQRECPFGDQFLIVGDDPMFGLWDPSCAVPLEWSDGHIWTAELDIPIGKSIQFKFILKGSTGEILWQPGLDRIFKTWETKNTITVCEDWEDAALQKIVEDDPFGNLNGETAINSEMVIAADNLNLRKEEPELKKVNEGTAIADGSSFSAQQPLPDTGHEQIIDNSIASPEERPVAIVADNISYPKEDQMADTSKKVLDNIISQPKKESMSISNKNMMIEEATFGGSNRAATVKKPANSGIEESLIIHEEGPVLVPGLTPISEMPAVEAIQDANERNVVDDASMRVNESKNHSLPELDEKQEPDDAPHQEETAEICNNGGEHLDDELTQRPVLAIEQQRESESIEDDVLQNDIQWGRSTLQKFLANLGLL